MRHCSMKCTVPHPTLPCSGAEIERCWVARMRRARCQRGITGDAISIQPYWGSTGSLNGVRRTRVMGTVPDFINRLGQLPWT